jgi:hypothetical protein
MNEKSKYCKFFQQNNCRFTETECRFLHQIEAQKETQVNKQVNQQASQPKGNKQSNQQEQQHSNQSYDSSRVLANQMKYVPSTNKKSTKSNQDNEYGSDVRLHKKNTESFEPNYNPADMRVLVEVAGSKSKTNLKMKSKDVIVVPDLFCQEEDWKIHDQLLKEMETCGIDSEKLWKLWHGDTHLIADDSTKFKERCPTFLKVLDRIRDYFGMDIKATRFNLYRDDKDFKPFHFDASAVKPEKAKIQNITIGVSFGRTREIAFEDALESKGHRRVISFPMPNGYTYCFTKDINFNWRHGVPAIPDDKKTNLSRISIIAWGWCEQEE